MLRSTATPKFPIFVNGALVRQHASELATPVSVMKKAMGIELWQKELATNRERFAAKFACSADSVGLDDSAEDCKDSPTLEEHASNPDILQLLRWLRDDDDGAASRSAKQSRRTPPQQLPQPASQQPRRPTEQQPRLSQKQPQILALRHVVEMQPREILKPQTSKKPKLLQLSRDPGPKCEVAVKEEEDRARNRAKDCAEQRPAMKKREVALKEREDPRVAQEQIRQRKGRALGHGELAVAEDFAIDDESKVGESPPPRRMWRVQGAS